MDTITLPKFYFNRLMLTLIFGIWASEPSQAWQMIEKVGPDRVKAFATSCLKNDLKDFVLGEEWFISPLGKHPSFRNPSQSYYHHEIMWR